MKKIVQFIKYNNFFTISVLLILLGSGITFAASPDTILSSKDKIVSIDNTYIRSVNLDTFNPNLTINKISEDPTSYFVEYSYNTIDLKGSVWQPLTAQKTLTVLKTSLGDKDLGLYVSDQLGQVIDSQLAYLKEAQKIEIAKGATYKVVATEYAGLIGSRLSTKTKTFNGYTPVIPPKVAIDTKQPPPPEGSLEGRSQSIPLAEQIAKQNAADAIKRMVDDALRQQQQQQDQNQSPETPTDPVVTPPVTDATTTPPIITNPGTTTPPVTDPATTTPPTDPVVTPPVTDPATTTPPAVTTNDVTITPVPDTASTTP